MKFKIFYFLLSAVTLVFFTNCSKVKNVGSGKEIKKLLVVHAGSLSIPFKRIADEFMEVNPDIKVILESYGSRTAARQVSDLKREVDVVASADSDVIKQLLYPEYADYCIDFTTNEMVIVYSNQSKYKDEINSSNWFDVFMRDGVEYGHSDPNSDPCGYRAVLTVKLAEIFYKKEGLFKAFSENTNGRNIRPKEVDLLAMIEAGELDYLFIYRSVAEQHGLKYLLLPPQINLVSGGYADLYSKVSIDITGKKPGEFIKKRGAPMVYGITIPNSVKHKNEALRFVEFIFSERGRVIMKANGQPVLTPILADNPEALPKVLKKYLK